MKLVALLKYHMNLDTIDYNEEQKFFCALQYIIDHGAFADQQKSLLLLGEAEQTWKQTVGSSEKIPIQWGTRLQLGDCETSQCAFGPLIFNARDFGEWLKIPINLARRLQVETAVEAKQCVSIHFAAGIWHASYKRKRAPLEGRLETIGRRNQVGGV